jgi:ferrous iron transport protein B
MGFGCTVPAIMATRTLENRNDRMITMLINPFMSCSARLPVYILLLGAFFPGDSGTVLFLLYLLGIAFAVIIAIILKKTMFRREQVPFVMELPPYRIPTYRVIVLHMWDKGVQYLRKIGGIILIASIIIWALGYFPVNVDYSKDYDTLIKGAQDTYEARIKIAKIQGITDTAVYAKALDEVVSELQTERNNEQRENSYIARIGQFVEPVMEPLGFDWRMCVSIVAGVAGKEVVVSTMAVLYGGTVSVDQHDQSLMNKLRTQKHYKGSRTGQFVFTPLIALSFMVFVLLYFPCMSTIAVIANESGSWKWGLFAIVYTTAIAWIVSWLVYTIGSLFA